MGSRNKATMIAQTLLEGEAEALVGKVVQLALEGDLTCLRICLERLVPPKKDLPLSFTFPEISSLADIPNLLRIVTDKLGRGEITPSETKIMIDLADTTLNALEFADFQRRLFELEKKLNSKGA